MSGWEGWCSWVLVVVWVLRLTLVNPRFRLALSIMLNAFKFSIQNAAPQILRVHSMQTSKF